MAFNFPASPTVGQKYPQPAIAGVPIYTWDGEKWTTQGGTVNNTRASIFIGDNPPPSPVVGDLWLESDSEIVFAYYGDTDSKQWMAVSAGNGNITGAVRYDAVQALLSAQQTQARSNVGSAPFDSLSYNGMQINGSMEIAQERGINAPVATGRICDGWANAKVGSMVLYCINGPSGYVPGISCQLSVVPSTAQPVLGASDSAGVYQAIEGYRMARLNWGTVYARPITIAFWTQHHRTGVYSVCVQNQAASRTYVTSYTQDVADAIEYKVVTIPGCTDGTPWNITNGVGFYIAFTIAAGTGCIIATPNQWSTGALQAAPGQVNGVGTLQDAFRLTGVVILPGVEAPSAERSPYIMRPWDQELSICQRYYEKTYPYADPPGKAYSYYLGGNPVSSYLFAASNYATMPWWYRVTKRAAATLTIYSPYSGAAGMMTSQNGNVDVAGGVITTSPDFMGFGVSNVALIAGINLTGHAVADARLA